MTRTTFQALRRAYRATRGISLLADGALEARMAAQQALMKYTGHWDDFTPATLSDQRRLITGKTARNGAVCVLRWNVWAACTRFCRATRNA